MCEDNYIKHYYWMNAIKGGVQRDVYAVLYALGGSTADGVGLSIAAIAEMAGHSAKQTKRAVAELREQGLIVTKLLEGLKSTYLLPSPKMYPAQKCTQPKNVPTTQPKNVPPIINKEINNKCVFNNAHAREEKKRAKFKKPTAADVQAYCDARANGINGAEFCDFYESKGWLVGKSPMKDWQAAVRTWEKYQKQKQYQNQKQYATNRRDNNNGIAAAVRAAQLGIALAAAE